LAGESVEEEQFEKACEANSAQLIPSSHALFNLTPEYELTTASSDLDFVEPEHRNS